MTRASAEAVRARIEDGAHAPAWFRAALLDVPARERDAWLDIVLRLEELPADGPALPRDGVPYLPCSVDALVRVIEQAPVTAADVFVDVGAGVGRALAMVALVTGAQAIGIEIQPQLARAADALARRIHLADRMTCLEGDAAEIAGRAAHGTVFFLYCPFSGSRFERVLARLEGVATMQPIRVCCLDLPLPATCTWLARDEPQLAGDLAIYRSR